MTKPELTEDLKNQHVDLTELPDRPRREISNLLVETVEGQVTLDDLLHFPTLFDHGTVTADTARGSFLTIVHVSPRNLQRATVSRIAYLSKLFSFWRGDLEFEVVVTKSKFQELKLLLVFVPGANVPEVQAMSAEELCGYQVSAIVDTSTDRVLKLKVPYIAETPWAPTSRSIGVFAVVLYDAMISVMDAETPASWSLFVSSPRGRDQMRFRNAVPPPRRTLGEGSATTIKDQIGNAYASASSSKSRKVRMQTQTALVTNESHVASLSTGGYPRDLRTCIPIYFRGRDHAVLAEKLVRLGVAPPASFTAAASTTFKSIVPYLPNLPCVQQALPTYANATSFYFAHSEHKTAGDFIGTSFSMGKNDAQFKLHMPDGLAKSFVGWRVIMTWSNLAVRNYVLFQASVSSGDYDLRFLTFDEIQSWNSDNHPANRFIAPGASVAWVDDPMTVREWDRSEFNAWLRNNLRAAELRTTSSHFNLYTTADPDIAEAVQEWLALPNLTDVPTRVMGPCFSLSLTDPRNFIESVEAIPQQKGPLMWLFRLFKGDETSTWGQVIRIADIIFDLLVPLVVGFDGEAFVYSIHDLSFRYLPDGEESESRVRVVQKPDFQPLEWVAEPINENVKHRFQRKSRSPEIEGARRRSRTPSRLKDAAKRAAKTATKVALGALL